MAWADTYKFAEPIIREALRPFLRTVFESTTPAGESGWEVMDKDRPSLKKPLVNRNTNDWDLWICLQIINDHFDQISPFFVKTHWRDRDFAPAVRLGWVSELNLLRNKHAHRIDLLTDNDHETFMFVGAALLRAIGDHDAAQQLDDLRLNAITEAIMSAAPLLVAHRIKHPNEPEFLKFLHLMKKEFPNPALRASDETLASWLAHHEFYFNRDPTPIDTIYLVAKDRNSDVVVGLLMASHFPKSNYMFICYLARDKQLALEAQNRGAYPLAEEITYKATRLLLQEVINITHWEKGIIAEVPRDEKYEDMKELFQYERHLFHSRLYVLNINYIQPSLDPSKPGAILTHDLLYMPGTEHQELIEAKGGLPHEQVLDILAFIYNDVYGASFEKTADADRYRIYAAHLLELVSEGLPKVVPLQDLSAW